LRATGAVRLAARLAPGGLALVLLVLSFSERDYLRAIGWSPVRRTRTEWPSVLALGPHGWVLTIAFVAAGALAIPAGWWLLISVRQRVLYAGSILFIVMGAGVMAVAFSADPPTASRESWHAHIHNLAYPVLVVAAISSAALFSCARSDERDWRRLRTASRLVLPVLLASVLISSFNTIAELGRYVLIGGLLAWAYTTARVAARLAHT
jgi:MFS family permease